ncbi:efflux RND transporter periplasmic adaptor subunit [Pseudodesulfovibrio sp. F-1]|uniref:Efflux RND transporter periplasmic adaptor subunit n=1 Tax=Pseudodesulfovibrio alkaliphilus TaxID=2661613 RepID=A0A7K1KL23_9BACT|nr:efflux RND transporter periplasmic adaptor subunit [Pseudodesulfovibrio alkaliphilus]MUM76783.1 efflux RND transporter periplasmic adaptor subunit [Pseudodesulfovibrio alkaliphilus]
MNVELSRTKQWFRLKAVIPVVIVVLAVAAAFSLIATSPRAAKAPPAPAAPAVSVDVFEKSSQQVTVSVMGTVMAAREINLKSRVAGEVVSASDAYVPGGMFAKGEVILRIDVKDYELTLREIKAEVTEAEYNLKVEQGYQNVAGREWDLLRESSGGTEEEAELALRKPHLEKAVADLEAARAKLDQARLDLERTVITAPFAAVVKDKSVDAGAMVSAQDALATLVCTDEFWVQASIPVDRLGWITLPNGDKPGSAATIINADGRTRREGRVIRLLPALEDEGRMARILISIPDPLNLTGEPGVHPLLLGSYVTVLVDGGRVDGGIAIPRSAFRDNGRIWVVSEDGTLDIRTVIPAWRDTQSVILTQGLEEGEQLVLSSLSAPVQGMALSAAGVLSRSGATGGTESMNTQSEEGEAHE